ncbi:MAG: entericidin A/B family lipoprotein [Xanthomonadales bacterium]|nr:entericidin A/B family lipoprotein [Xanthomonadales bacterium]
MRTRSLFRVLFAAVSLCALSACNTIHGAGQDIEKAGEEIQEAADDARD